MGRVKEIKRVQFGVVIAARMLLFFRIVSPCVFADVVQLTTILTYGGKKG